MIDELESLKENYTWTMVDSLVGNRKKKKFCLHQKSYLPKVLERFEIGSSKSLTTHVPQNYDQQHVTVEDRNYTSKVPYASALGSLLFSTICSRSDLAYAISLVSRFMENPGKSIECYKMDT